MIKRILFFASLLTFFSCEQQSKKESELDKFTSESIFNELKAREFADNKSTDTIPVRLNDSLSTFTARELYDMLKSREDVIYGDDDRFEIEEITDAPIRNNANTVVGFFRKSELTFLPGGKAVLKNKVSFKNSYLLCSDERFCDQWIGPFCTGFAVSKNTIASAGHCMKDVSLADFVCIFGYQLSSKGQIVDTFYAEQILHPTEIVKNGLTESNPNDYLFLKVQENIPSQRISQLDPNPLKGASDKIYVIGHPCGIPMKIGLNGSIRDNTNPNFFVSTLDTYGGNSGSPVFKAANNKVIGILIKGHKDFVTVEGCRKSFRCGVTECRGEDATRIAPLISIIPK